MANLAKTPKSAIFWNFAEGGRRENRPKSKPTSGTPKTTRRKLRYLLISMRLSAIIGCGQHFAAIGASISARNEEQWKIWQRHLNCPFSRILPKGDQGKIAQKSRPTWGAPKTPLHKSHYLLKSMVFKRNCWNTFYRKPRLQNCPQRRTMANLAKTSKSAIFWDFAKGGPRENRPKSWPTLGAPKTPRRKSRCLLISIRLKRNHRTTFCRNRRFQKTL